MTRRNLFCIALIALLLSSCNLTKYVPDDQYLLNRNKIKLNTNQLSSIDLEPYLQQPANNYTLGFMRTKLGFYSLSGDDTTKWTNRWLRKVGEPPVVYNQTMTDNTQETLRKVMSNRGFMDADVKVELDPRKNKRIDVTYIIDSHAPYLLNDYKIDLPDTMAMNYINRPREVTAVVKGGLFDVDQLNAERDRVVSLLRRHGFYNMQKNMLRYLADTTITSHQVDLTMRLQENMESDSALAVIFKRKRVDQITIYDVSDVSNIGASSTDLDTVYYNDYRVIYEHDKRNFTPKLLTTKTAIRVNRWYNESTVERTYNNLNGLSAVKYVNISFADKGDSLLDCSIYVSPERPHSFSLEVDGTHSDGDLGAAVSVSYQNKNIFQGAETFRIGVNGAYEAMGKVGQFYASRSIGGDMSLTIPSLVMPFVNNDFRKRYGGSTSFSTSYNFQVRPGYRRNIANIGMRYNWQASRVRYTFNLLDFSYVYLPWVSDDFRNMYLGPTSSIRFSYENHLIMRIGFGVSYTNQREDQPLRDYYTIRGDVRTAGNLLYGLSNLFQQQKDSTGAYNILNTPYSQYVKGDFDFSYNRIFNENTRLVFHMGLGIGIPYANASILPFEERYFSGGANSLRGWSVRSLGPGSYKNSAGYIDFMNQSGDIKLDLSLEARFKLFWKLYGAVFVDAGNIWTIRDYAEQPGGVFKFDKFYEQIGCSYGAGLRLDFSFFVIRVDMGIKLYDPSYTAVEDRWRSNLTWANDVAFHFAVGYPF